MTEPPAGPAPGEREAFRAAAKRRRARRGLGISALSSVVVLGGLAAFFVTRPGWDSFKSTFFDWDEFKTAFPSVLDGFWIDIKLFLIVEVAVLVLGLLIALARTTTAPALFPLRALAIVYTDVFRGVPTVLMVYLVGFGVPALEDPSLPSDPLVLGGIGLALSYSAYVAEVYRAGILTVHRSQQMAAQALGLTRVQTLRFVILPQAIRNIRAPLLNDFIALQKDVALVSILGPQEAFRVAQIYAAESFNYTPLIAAALLYLAVTFPLARIVDRMQLGSGARGRRSRIIFWRSQP